MGKYCGECALEKPREHMTRFSGQKLCNCYFKSEAHRLIQENRIEWEGKNRVPKFNGMGTWNYYKDVKKALDSLEKEILEKMQKIADKERKESGQDSDFEFVLEEYKTTYSEDYKK